MLYLVNMLSIDGAVINIKISFLLFLCIIKIKDVINQIITYFSFLFKVNFTLSIQNNHHTLLD